MSVLLLLQSQAGEPPPPPPVVVSGPALRKPHLPRIFFTADGQPLELADWSFDNQADLGYGQLRGIAVGDRARRFAHRVDQGSVIKAFTEHGVQVYEGDVPAPPKITQDGLVHIAAQGHGVQASKSNNRVSPLVTSPGAWVPANQPPLNFLTTSEVYVDVINLPTERSLWASSLTGGTAGKDWAIAFAARGMLLSRIRFDVNGTLLASTNWRVFTADYPNIEQTKRLQYSVTASVDITHDVTFTEPGDVVILQCISEGGATPASTITRRVLDPIVWGDFPIDLLYSQHAARIVGRQLGWDDIGVIGKGSAPHTSLDWAGDGAGFLSYIANLEGFCWGAWEDTKSDPDGPTPLLSFGPYGRRTWEVSGRTGARWDLDPLERVRGIVMQYLNTDNSANEITIEAPESAHLPEGVASTLLGSLSDAQMNTALPVAVAWNLLRAYLSQRHRGRISFARAFDSHTRREATYEVRAGDLIRITDFAMDGAITLPAHDVTFTSSGCVVGVEAMALPLGGGITGKGTVGAGVGRGRTPITSTTGGTAVYVPPASGGGAPGGGIWQGGGGGWPGGGGPRLPGRRI